MPKEISSITPDKIPGKQRPIPKITWNDRTLKSYKDNGFYDAENYNIPPIDKQELEFLSVVDERQGPIVREISTMIRIKAIDYTTENKERKEYLYWFENWYGNNWLGVPIAPVTDHIEGMYYEQLKQLVLDPKTGDAAHYVRKGQREAYYIPSTKKEVDRVLAQYKANPQLIKFVVKFSNEDSPDGQMRSDSRGQFSYDQFTTWTFDDLYKLHIRPWKESEINVGAAKSLYK